MKVLIAEDYKPSLEKLVSILSKSGHEIATATEGREAIEMYKKDVFDIVFIDWTMPDMDSIELCRDIKDINILRQRDSYMIMITGTSKKRDMVSALEAGADDFVLKPFEEHVVKSRIQIGERVLEARRSNETKSSRPVDILQKEHVMIHRITGIMEMVSNMLDEDRPIPKKLLAWCTSSAFILDFKLHEKKEDYYINIFIERAKETHGRTSELFTRSSLVQILREHEWINTLLKNMQKTLNDYTVHKKDEKKVLKKYLDRYVQLIRTHAAREDTVFFPFTARYFTPEDEKQLLVDFKRVENEIGTEDIDNRMKTLDVLEKAMKLSE